MKGLFGVKITIAPINRIAPRVNVEPINFILGSMQNHERTVRGVG